MKELCKHERGGHSIVARIVNLENYDYLNNPNLKDIQVIQQIPMLI